MKYFSEVTNKLYESPEALQEAEQKVLEHNESVKATKSRLAKEIENAEQRLCTASKNYDEAVKEFNLKCAELRKELIEPAQQEISDASKAKYEALKEFSSRFGTYTKQYSDEEINDILENLTVDPVLAFLANWF